MGIAIFFGLIVYSVLCWVLYRYAIKKISIKLVRYICILVIVLLPTWDVVVGCILYPILNSTWAGTDVYNTVNADSVCFDGLNGSIQVHNDNIELISTYMNKDKKYKYIEFVFYEAIDDKFRKIQFDTPLFCKINYDYILNKIKKKNSNVLICDKIKYPSSRYWVSCDKKRIGSIQLGEKYVTDMQTGEVLGERRWLSNPFLFPFFAWAYHDLFIGKGLLYYERYAKDGPMSLEDLTINGNK